MQFIFYCGIVILLVINNVHSHQSRFKRAHADNFNVLLNIYKMNPLKKSNLYKTFSDQVLLPNRPDMRRVVMNFDSNESRKERLANTNLHLKQIEKFIHVTNTKKKVIRQPDYDIENVDPEKFTFNMVNDPLFGVNDKKGDENNFNFIFGHLESGEISDKLPVTKMVRVKNNINERVSESEFNGIGLSDNYTYASKNVNYETIDNKQSSEATTMNNYVDENKEERKLANEGVVVLR